MKKYFLIILSYISIITASNADAVTDYISNLIPGDGDTELSIDLRENHSADFSILLVRELDSNQSNNTFTQLSLFNTEKNSDDRIVANLGLGKRFLSEDKFSMTGINAFVDYDDEGNLRSSIGLEMRNAVLNFAFNNYFGMDDADGEKVLDGYDMRLASQIPYIHWADFFINSYSWDGVKRDDVEGLMYGTEMLLSPNINLEIAFDDKDKAGLDDEYYAKIIFVHPPRNSVSISDGISSDMWRAQKDMSDEMLTKVKRNNKIFVEFNGSANIVRAD
ncbi:inverse autotransporter beta domain-containing protein [Candidatus Pelagibacter sp.]|nr:inverse autotransporter beta domain-containing protein [Candidatus Pelagibacter sp.]